MPLRLSVPTTHSAMAFAFGARTAVRTVLLEMENEILKRAAALFARENVLPK